MGSPLEKCRREEAEAYADVVLQIDSRWRVVRCRDDIQWILQKKEGQRHGEARWGAVGYFRTREGLEAYVRASRGQEATLALGQFPERYIGKADSVDALVDPDTVAACEPTAEQPR